MKLQVGIGVAQAQPFCAARWCSNGSGFENSWVPTDEVRTRYPAQVVRRPTGVDLEKPGTVLMDPTAPFWGKCGFQFGIQSCYVWGMKPHLPSTILMLGLQRFDP